MNVQNFNSLQDIYGIRKNFKLDMRKRNTIRLNESKLHNMISESVKQVLSELDWKTYASAASKAKKIGDPRFEKFSKASDDAFNSDEWFSPEEYDHDGIGPYRVTKKGSKLLSNWHQRYYDNNGVNDIDHNAEKDYSIPNSDWKGKWERTSKKSWCSPVVRKEWEHNVAPYNEKFWVRNTQPYRRIKTYTDNAFHMRNADRAMSDFYNGNYIYDKSRGKWVYKK